MRSSSNKPLTLKLPSVPRYTARRNQDRCDRKNNGELQPKLAFPTSLQLVLCGGRQQYDQARFSSRKQRLAELAHRFGWTQEAQTWRSCRSRSKGLLARVILKTLHRDRLPEAGLPHWGPENKDKTYEALLNFTNLSQKVRSRGLLMLPTQSLRFRPKLA